MYLVAYDSLLIHNITILRLANLPERVVIICMILVYNYDYKFNLKFKSQSIINIVVILYNFSLHIYSINYDF